MLFAVRKQRESVCVLCVCVSHQFLSHASDGLQISNASASACSGLQQLLSRAGDIPNDDMQFAFWLSSHMPIALSLKQDLLEMINPMQRMQRLLDILSLPAQNPHNCHVQ